MAKFRFGKKDSREDEIDKQRGYEDEVFSEDDLEEDLYYESEEEDFFDDDFGRVSESEDIEDLDTDAEFFAEELREDMDYTGYEPKWYEKGTNIAITVGILLVLTVSTVFYFREPIRVLIGTTSEELQEIDLRGEVDEYAEGVKETLSREETKKMEEEEEFDLEEVDYIGEGEYVVGKDIEAGIWIAKDVLVDVYGSQEDYEDKKDPINSNVRLVDMQRVIGLNEGQFVVVQGGELVLNRTRPSKIINVRDTFIIKEKNHQIIGKDIPEGFYTLYNVNIIEQEDKKIREQKINKLNPREDESKRFGVERKTTVFFREGLIIETEGNILAERVSADGTYGDDGNLLHEMTSEELKDLEEQETEEVLDLDGLMDIGEEEE